MRCRNALLSLLIVLLFCLPGFARQSPNLLDDSKVIFDLKPYGHTLVSEEGIFHLYFMDPLWLSENSLFAHSRIGDGFFLTPYQIDLKQRRLTVLDGLGKLIRDCKGATWRLSTDHRWILWRRGWLEDHYDLMATRPDGTKSVRWTVKRADADGPFFWMPGTHQWIHLLLRKDGTSLREAQLFDVDHPHRKRVIPLPPIQQTDLLGVLPSGALLLTDREEFDKHPYPITELRFVGNRAMTRHWTLPTPHDGVTRDPVREVQFFLSPDGRLISWLVQRGEETGTEGYPHPKQAVLYVTDIYGKQSRRIGTIPLSSVRDSDYTLLHGWFPDNKRILLQSHSRLYSVEAR